MNNNSILEDHNQSNNKQFQQMLSIIDYLLEESNNSQNPIVNPEELWQLKQEFSQNHGENLSPAQLNTTILMLLDYVVKTISLM